MRFTPGTLISRRTSVERRASFAAEGLPKVPEEGLEPPTRGL